MNARFPILVVCTLLLAACAPEPELSDTQRVNAIATEFVDAYYEQFPEEVYEVGYPDAPQDRFGDHSPERLAAWHSNVDAWRAQLDAIDVGQLAGTPEAVTYVFTRERLQAIVDRRACETDLWNISPTWTGWQFSIISTLAVQPVETPEERDAALARVADIARFLDTEIANLQQGLDKGYTAPQSNVDRVIEQVTSLIDTPVDESPFSTPANNSDDAEFAAAYHDIVADQVVPALIRYRDFLANDYDGA